MNPGAQAHPDAAVPPETRRITALKVVPVQKQAMVAKAKKEATADEDEIWEEEKAEKEEE